MCLEQHNNHKQKLLVIHTSTKESRCLSQLSIEEEDDDSLITFTNRGFGDVVASCHELLLTVREEFGEKENLALLNIPTNDFIKTLPQTPRPPPSVQYKCKNVIFGLGLAAPDDYKVIRYREVMEVDEDFRKSSCFMGYDIAELYSLNTDSWKRIPYPHAYETYPSRAFLGRPVHINGFCYWPAYTGSGREEQILANEIFPCDLIPWPGGYKRGKHGNCRFFLAEFEGSLALVVHLFKENLFELWVWNHKEESWSRRGAWAISAQAPLTLVKNHLFYFQDSMGELVLFDSATQKLKKLGLCDTSRLLALPFVCLTRTT